MVETASISGYITLAEAEKFYGVKANTLKKQCLGGKFPGAIKKGKTWFVPEIPRTASHQDYMAVIYGYERIYGFDGGGVDRIAKEVSEHNLYSILETLSKITLKLYSKGFLNSDTQFQLIKDIFANDLGVRRKILDSIVKGKKPGERRPIWIIFAEQSILNLLKIVLIHSKKKGGRPIKPEDVGKVGHWLLLATDIWAGSEVMPAFITPINYQREKIREYLTREHFLMVRERLPYKLVRFNEIIKTIERKGEFDIKDIFLKASNGVTLENYLYVCFLLLVNWINKTTKEPDISKEWIVCRDKFFSKVKESGKEIDDTLSLLLLNIDNFEADYAKDVKELLGKNDFPPFNFLQFQKHPLIPVNQKCFVCLSPHFLMEKISEGTYWTITNYLKANNLNKERDLLPSVWGDAFEEYMHKRLTSAFKDRYIRNYSVNGEEKFDGVFNGQNVVFLIEDKYAHWTYKAKLIGKREDMLPTLKQIFSGSKKVKGLGQITRGIKEFENKKWRFPFSIDGKKIVPVIIVGESMPMDAYNRKMYEDIAKESGAFYENDSVSPFIILDAEEVEIVEAIAVSDGTDTIESLLFQYSQIFKERNPEGYTRRSLGFKNYLYSIRYPVPNNIAVMKKFDKIADFVEKKAFPKQKRAKSGPSKKAKKKAKFKKGG